MTKRLFSKIIKRDGRKVKFESEKIIQAIEKAGQATGEFGREVAEKLAAKVLLLAKEVLKDKKTPTVEEIQDIVELVLFNSPFWKTARAYAIYREQHRQLREIVSQADVSLVDKYLEKVTWEIRENSNMTFSLQGLNNYVSSKIISTYWLNKIYPEEIRKAHEEGDFHLHDLSNLSVYCVGWDLYDLLLKGFGGVPGKIESKPAKHFHSALGQLVNFLYSLQGETAGAVAVSNFDTLLAPFIYYDKLSYREVSQALQEFLFNMNVPTRVGFQTPFSNITLDLTPPPQLANSPVLIGGKLQDKTYKEFQKEIDIFNKALLENFLKGDGKGRVFSFPIPTYNITKDFDWGNKNLDLLWRVTAKYGLPYFANFINSDMKPEDIRSMCLYPEEEVLIRNNRKVKRRKIGEIVESYRRSEFDKDGWSDCRPEKNLEVLSLNYQTGRTEWAKVIRFLKVKDDKLVTIFTNEGKRIKVSSKHLVPVLTPEGLINKFAEDVKEGDYLLGLKKSSSLNDDGEYQKLNDKLVLNEDLAKILGYFTADGNYLFETRKNLKTFGLPRGLQFTFNAKTKENVEEIKSLIKKIFNLEVKERKDPRYHSYYLYLYKADLARILWQAGFRKYGRLPDILFNSPLKVIKSFLLYHFKGDGYLKRKEIHINDKELARDLVLLYSLIGKPVTYRQRRNSQVIYLQHGCKERDKDSNFLLSQTLSQRVPGFLAKSTYLVPGLRKSRMVGLETLRKYRAVTQLSRRIEDSDYYISRVKKVEVKNLSDPQTFFDLELDKNHLFIHSLGTITHNCCRLRIDNRKLEKRGGGLFGSSPLTGSIGVVTINMPRLGYLSKSKKEFKKRLERLMVLAKNSLEIKRKTLEKLTDKGLYPYSRYYLSGIKRKFSQWWKNHFSTIGLVGMNEACLNLFGEDIASEKSRKFTLEILDFMRKKLIEFQKETGNNYNLEATPAEGVSYRLPQIDLKKYPDIITAGTQERPFYTNSTQLPVNYTDDIFEAIELQDKFQCMYTGGTVVHLFVGEKISQPEIVKKLVKKVFEKFNLPYLTITPTFSICPNCGYLPGEQYVCPKCKANCEVYSRVVGYLRPVNQWNDGKQEEFKERKTFKIKE